MGLKEDVQKIEKKANDLEKDISTRTNFDLGNTFKNIIYFLFVLIMVLLGIIIFFVAKNNQLAKELSDYTCETDIMEQEGMYNFIDSKGNMITTDAQVLEKFIDDYYDGEAKENN